MFSELGLDDTVIDTNVNTNEPASEPLPKRSKTTPLILDGKYYVFEGDEMPVNGPITARCTTCHKDVKGHSKSTGNFINHYRTTHDTIFDELTAFLNNNSRVGRRVKVDTNILAREVSKDEVSVKKTNSYACCIFNYFSSLYLVDKWFGRFCHRSKYANQRDS